MIKKVVFAGMLIIAMSINVFADSVNLYASVDDSSSTCNLLTDIMRNDPEYDPYNEFVVLRSAQDEYRLYFGKDLSVSSVKYTYRNSSMGSPPSINRTTSGPLQITNNGYIYAGNTEGAAGSLLAEQYKTYYVITFIGICVLIFIIFKLFKRKVATGVRSYRVR